MTTDQQLQQIAAEIGMTAEIVQLTDASPLEARAAAISEALNDPFIDSATACELIDELAAIEIQIERNN